MVMQKCALLLSEISAIWSLSNTFFYLRRKVSYEEGAKFAKDNDLVFM